MAVDVDDAWCQPAPFGVDGHSGCLARRVRADGRDLSLADEHRSGKAVAHPIQYVRIYDQSIGARQRSIRAVVGIGSDRRRWPVVSTPPALATWRRRGGR